MRSLQFAITALWIAMSWLLIRSEFGDLRSAGTSIPPDVVWRKLIESGDQSMLALTQGGATNRLGSFRWLPTALETVAASNAVDAATLPEGMAQGVSGYSLDFDGSFLLYEGDHASRVRVSSRLQTDAAGAWTHWHLQVGARPDSWTVEASAAERSVRILAEGPRGAQDLRYTFDELANPAGWISRVSGLPAAEFLMPILASLRGGRQGGFLVVDARKDHRLRFGRQTVRCLRLKATLLGAYSAVLYVNPQSGEIIRIDLPERVMLVNESFL
ncbi:MAG: hypothetical protein HYR88_11265 [Verrucomicrobia bacterium]|nr:hypothetical protein [Verrucomicrobiota bacterium]MBI3870820.1 hypothetical protein [Verrucomicrobiota bacterium]